MNNTYKLIRQELNRNNTDLLLEYVRFPAMVSVDELAMEFQKKMIYNEIESLDLMDEISLLISKSFYIEEITSSEYVSIIQEFFQDCSNAESRDEIYEIGIKSLMKAKF